MERGACPSSNKVFENIDASWTQCDHMASLNRCEQQRLGTGHSGRTCVASWSSFLPIRLLLLKRNVVSESGDQNLGGIEFRFGGPSKAHPFDPLMHIPRRFDGVSHFQQRLFSRTVVKYLPSTMSLVGFLHQPFSSIPSPGFLLHATCAGCRKKDGEEYKKDY